MLELFEQLKAVDMDEAAGNFTAKYKDFGELETLLLNWNPQKFDDMKQKFLQKYGDQFEVKHLFNILKRFAETISDKVKQDLDVDELYDSAVKMLTSAFGDIIRASRIK